MSAFNTRETQGIQPAFVLEGGGRGLIATRARDDDRRIRR